MIPPDTTGERTKMSGVVSSETSVTVIKPTRPTRGRWWAIASWAYAALVLAVLALLRTQAERWWLATVLLFVPRGLFLIPVVVLTAGALHARRWRLAPTLVATAVVVAWPLMGLSLPIGRLIGARPEGTTVRILSFNRSTRPIDTERLIRLVEKEGIDVICFQEKSDDPALDDYLSQGWHRDSKGYLASRLPIVEELDPTQMPHARHAYWPVFVYRAKLRAASGREFLLASVHMPTMRYGFQMLKDSGPAELDRYIEWRWEQARRLVGRLDEAGDVPVLIGGDFNMPADSPIFGALRSRYQSAFDVAGFGYGYTFPTHFPCIRIDHILAGPEWTFTRCWVGPDLGSDHLPLIAEAVLRD